MLFFSLVICRSTLGNGDHCKHALLSPARGKRAQNASAWSRDRMSPYVEIPDDVMTVGKFLTLQPPQHDLYFKKVEPLCLSR